MKYNFWIHNYKDKKGRSKLYLRISIEGKDEYIDLDIRINKNEWDKNRNRLKPISIYNFEVNQRINEIEDKIIRKKLQLSANNIRPTFAHFDSINSNFSDSFLIFFEHFIKNMKPPHYEDSTVKVYKNVFKKVSAFLKAINMLNLGINDWNRELIEDFESFLYKEYNLSVNSRATHLKKIKKIINTAVDDGIIERNPIERIKIKTQEGKVTRLTINELNELYDLFFSTTLDSGFEKALAPFLFSCYTGLRFSDVKALKKEDIKEGVIQINMNKKTNAGVHQLSLKIPKKAMQIAKSQSEDYHLEVFPRMLSNQKTNLYLKAIAKIANIDKHIKYHVSRHTFATISLSVLGIDIKTVSSLLGHRSVKTTEIYAKVLNESLYKNMKKWDEL